MSTDCLELKRQDIHWRRVTMIMQNVSLWILCYAVLVWVVHKQGGLESLPLRLHICIGECFSNSPFQIFSRIEAGQGKLISPFLFTSVVEEGWSMFVKANDICLI